MSKSIPLTIVSDFACPWCFIGKRRMEEAMAPNTLSAHVLMFWAGNDERIDGNTLAEKLFNAHHVACENIGDHKVLARIAGEVGMDKAEVMAKLKAGDDENKVREHIHQSSTHGISGVPFFIINEQYGIAGAQPAASLMSAFEQVVNGDGQQD
jgi:predicted DsbA family dithiol-disulfide isomerase